MSHQDELFENDPLFAGLRAYGASAENSPADLPMAIGKAFRSAHQNHLRRRKLIRRVLAPTTAITILVPSLAYAHVLPAVISQPVTRAVQVVAHAINRPVVAVRNEISRITASNAAPSTLPTPDITVLNTPTPSATEVATQMAPATPTLAAPVISQRARDEEVISAPPITPMTLPNLPSQRATQLPPAGKSHEDSHLRESSAALPTHRAEVRDTHTAESAPQVEPTSTRTEGRGQNESSNSQPTSRPSESARPEPTRTGEGSNQNQNQSHTNEARPQTSSESTPTTEVGQSSEPTNHG